MDGGSGRVLHTAAEDPATDRSVLLVRPFDGVRAEDRTYDHLGIGYLSSYLESQGIPTEVSDMVLGEDATPDDVAERVARDGHLLVGITASSQLDFPKTVELAETIKRAAPVHICIGGHFPTVAHDRLLRDFPCIDSVVRGEGEIPLAELAHRVLAGVGPLGVRGVSHRRGDDVVVEPAADLIQDLDALPFPKRHHLAPEYGGIRYASMASSRGCPYRCSFCSIHAFYGCGWRARSVDDVVEEMVELNERHGCNGFDFADDSFVPPGQLGVERVHEFCAALRESGLRDITLIALFNAASVKDESIRELRGVGLRSVLLGVESASNDVLRRFRKGANTQRNEAAIRTLHENGIEVNAGFIMFDPDTTFDDIEANVAFLRRHASYLIFELLSRVTVYTGTELSADLEAQGRLLGDYLRPDYEFANPRIGWLHAVSSGLMETWMGVVSDWTRGFRWGTDRLPVTLRRTRRQEMFRYALEVFSELAGTAREARSLPGAAEAIERLAPGVDAGFEQLVRPVSGADLDEIRALISAGRPVADVH